WRLAIRIGQTFRSERLGYRPPVRANGLSNDGGELLVVLHHPQIEFRAPRHRSFPDPLQRDRLLRHGKIRNVSHQILSTPVLVRVPNKGRIFPELAIPVSVWTKKIQPHHCTLGRVPVSPSSSSSASDPWPSQQLLVE